MSAEAAQRFQRGLGRLALGDFAGGWDDYEERWGSERFLAESRGWVPPALVPELTLRPTAGDLAGRRILLLGEQGAGDQVMFASALPDLLASAASVFCVCEPRLVRLFSAAFPQAVFKGPKEAVVDSDEIDRVVAIGSLGAAYRRDPASFPGTPYLAPRDEVRARWAARLGPKPEGLRIGISWQGGAATTRREDRSLPLAALAPILDLPGCEIVSLQHGDVAEALAQRPAVRAFPPQDVHDFEELAGLVAGCDVVVSVQNSLVHLAGALGVPCLALVPHAAEWRYMARGEAMAWYRSVRLYRQPAPGDWTPVVREVAAALAERLPEAAQEARLGALVNLGAAWLDRDRFDLAEPPLRRALALRPGEPTALRNLAILLQSQERYAEVLALTEGADGGAAWLARGNALAGLDRQDEALQAFREADARGEPEASVKVAQALAALGRVDEALAILDRLVDPQARFQRGMLRLQQQAFARGWRDYEARWEVPRFVAAASGVVPAALIPRLARAPWPQDLAGRRVLLMGEQGLGDQVMFASMVPDLARTAAEVTFVCDARLTRLFAASFPGVAVTGPAEARVDLGAFDRFVAVGGLGSAFRRGPADFPGTAYLKPGDDVRDRWAGRLGRKSRRRIGLAWRGGLPRTRAGARSLPLDRLAPILALDAEFVSLQHGDAAAELAGFPHIRAFPAEQLADFEELAGLVANLDLVVTVQTGLVHLCGALGTECLAMVAPNTGWRYMTGSDRTPWYASVRLFRQPQAGDWAPVVEAVAAELSRP